MERGDGGRRLLVWDAPYMDRCLSEVLSQRASATTRPNLGAILRWAAGRPGPERSLEAAVFCVVPPGLEARMAPWVVNLRLQGFAVFAKPAASRRDEVGGDLRRHVERRLGRGLFAEVIIASHGDGLLDALRRWRTDGVDVTVLGYREKAGDTAADPDLTFVDVEDVAGAFERPLPRTNLFDLPRSGRWFDPLPPAEGGGSGSTSGNGLHDAATAARKAPAPGSPPAPPPAPAPGSPAPGSAAPVLPSAAASPSGAANDASLVPVAARGAPEPSTADGADLLSEVAAEVEAAMAAGSPGLLLRQVGDLVRGRFGGSSLADLGFTTVAELVDRLEAGGRLQLVRLPDGGHLLRTATPAGPPTADPRDADPRNEDPRGADLRDEGADAGGKDAGDDDPGADDPRGARSLGAEAEVEAGTVPPAEPATDGRPPVDEAIADPISAGPVAADAATTGGTRASTAAGRAGRWDHPIYRIFGVPPRP